MITRIKSIDSQYQPSDINVSILHIGLGAFHRAHQAVYIEKLLNHRKENKQWGICSVNIRSNKDIVDSLIREGYQFHVAEYIDNENITLRQIKSIRDTIFAGKNGSYDDNQKLLQKIADKRIRLMTLTITEKGYYINSATGDLIEDNPDIQHDIKNPKSPITAIGILVEGLRLRQQKHHNNLTILSCDNMPENGKRLQSAVISLAKKQSIHLSSWIEKHISFPCSMVDRIVPAMTQQRSDDINTLLQIQDPLIIQTENFSQWIVENDRHDNYPPWQEVGVIVTDNVHVFENAKLRMLNGSHSLLAYLGQLASYEYVSDAIHSPIIRQYIEHYLINEASKTIGTVDGLDLSTYSEQLLARFGNNSLAHKLSQIASDGSQKIPQRWLAHCLSLIELKQPIDATVLGIASWIKFIEQKTLTDSDIDDPLGAKLKNLVNDYDHSDELIDAFLSQTDIFSPALVKHSIFTETVKKYYTLLSEKGALEAMKAVLNQTQTL